MTIFYPPFQEKVFIIMLIFGMIVGFIYDLFLIKRRLFGTNCFVLFVDDLLFVFISLISFLFTVFCVNNGIFRWYEMLFSFLGFVLYRTTVSRLILFISYKIVDLSVYLLKLVCRIFISPFTFVFKKIVLLSKPLLNLTTRLFYVYKITKTFNYDFKRM